MPKKREKNEFEYYRGQIRELEKKNRSLEKQLKQTSKYPKVERLPKEEPNKLICSSCGKGELSVFSILDKTFTTCKLCGDRKKI